MQQRGRQEVLLGVPFPAQRLVHSQRMALILGGLPGEQHPCLWGQALGCPRDPPF
jgi:hypothetical protein